jgi:soluble lytic murein transglycosylase-like protein
MAVLRTVFLVLPLFWPSLAAANPLDRWSTYIAAAASRFDIPKAWIWRVIRAESDGRTSLNGRPIVSHAGAMGLMQLMPGTWRDMRALLGLGSDPHDPRDNIFAGTAYLRLMYDRFGYPGLFAAYNAGPARYAEHLATGRSLPKETIAYVTGLAAGGTDDRAGAANPVPLLFVLRGHAAAVSANAQGAPAPVPGSLFFALGQSNQR